MWVKYRYAGDSGSTIQPHMEIPETWMGQAGRVRREGLITRVLAVEILRRRYWNKAPYLDIVNSAFMHEPVGSRVAGTCGGGVLVIVIGSGVGSAREFVREIEAVGVCGVDRGGIRPVEQQGRQSWLRVPGPRVRAPPRSRCAQFLRPSL